jgi:hypothetical protein
VEVLNPADESKQVANTTQSKNESAVSGRASPIRIRKIADILYFHRLQITEGTKTFVAKTFTSTDVLESYPLEHRVHRVINCEDDIGPGNAWIINVKHNVHNEI